MILQEGRESVLFLQVPQDEVWPPEEIHGRGGTFR
jgi:hypothetical protein